MNKRLILGASLISLLAIFLLLSGCGDYGSDDASKAESAAPAEEAATTETVPETAAETAAETATEAVTEIVAAHDCAGGCGMHAVPEDQMTEIEGKWYCAGCAKKAASGGDG